MKEIIVKILKEHIKTVNIENHIEIPPNLELGDYSFPCFLLSKEMKKAPNIIALELKNKIEKKLPKEIESIQVLNGYLNFFINKNYMAEQVINKILKQKENYGRSKNEKEKIMIEFPSPNTNKPLHLGHLRNMSIGESVSRILEFNNNKVIRVNLNNDRGIHICKSKQLNTNLSSQYLYLK